MLKDVGTEDRSAIAARVRALGDQAIERPQMTALLEGFKGETGVMKDVAADLAQMLPDIPDASLQSDWRYLCTQISRDLLVTPDKTLERLNAAAHKSSGRGQRARLDGRVAREFGSTAIAASRAHERSEGRTPGAVPLHLGTPDRSSACGNTRAMPLRHDSWDSTIPI